ncbi:MAG: hypothetical protein FWB83_05470 [Treponema sp.]|nr:hypothetical protein [Treponema sp.]
MKINKVIKTIFTIGAFILLPLSCSDSQPWISYGFIQLVLYQSDEGPKEYFSFFVIAEDDEGPENLEDLYLYHDREQLRWHINSEDWVTISHEEKTWIGTRGISIQQGSLPRGSFRAVLVNKGGESSQRVFNFDGAVRFPFPEITVSGGVYTVNSQWPVNRLVCYNREGDYAITITLESLSGRVSQLRLPSVVRTASLWVEDEDNFCSAFTDAVQLVQ